MTAMPHATPVAWPDAFPPVRRAAGWRRWGRLALWVVLALLLGGLLQWLWAPGGANPLALNFDFLWRTSGVGISESRLAYSQQDTFLWLILTGFANTVALVLPVCAAATLWGVVVGLLRLSRNPLLAGITAAYVQVMRNIPLLLQILMWYVVFLNLPPVAASHALGDWLFLNQRGAFFPGVVLRDGWPIQAVVTLVALLLGGAVLRRLQQARVAWHWRWLWLAGVLAGLLWLLHGAVGFELPRRGNFNFSGGAAVSIEFFTLFVALSVYTSAYIAEIVRGGVLSVRRGQSDAAQALGMGELQTLWLVILPQAWRAIIPPLLSQIVNIVKNSSLAIAVGFPDLLWALTTVIGVTNRTLEAVILLFVLYLIPSLLASALLSMFNRRVLARS